jgi:hypothetical protein
MYKIRIEAPNKGVREESRKQKSKHFDFKEKTK